MKNFYVIGTDHFPWPPEEFNAGSFATEDAAEKRAGELNARAMTSARISESPLNPEVAR